MSWIQIIPYAAATGKLRKIYDRVKAANNYIDNILMVHSLRPHTLTGHMYLYKNVLHHQENTLPKWYLEAIGIYVSLLNNCAYCVDHHSAGLKILLPLAEYHKIISSLNEETLEYFSKAQKIGLKYARHLTLTPAEIQKELVTELIQQGFSEGEVLEINQVVAYFNYANRTVLGLGVSTVRDQLGLSPSSVRDDDWVHG